MVKLRWLQINKYRSVKPGTRLIFNPGYNVLLGQNGSGKTTLLNLVAAVAKSDFSGLGDDEFDLEYELASEGATAVVAVRRAPRASVKGSSLEVLSPSGPVQEALSSAERLRSPTLSADVKITRDAGASLIGLELRGAQGQVWRKNEEETSPPASFGSIAPENYLWANVTAGLNGLPELRSALQLSDSFTLFYREELSRFDESLEHFSRFRTARFSFNRFPDGHISGGREAGFQELWEGLSRSARVHWQADLHTIPDEHLPFLRSVTRLLGFDSAEAVVQLLEANTQAGHDSITLGSLRFLFSKGKRRFSDQLLSYGQKRMLAFMHYLSSVGSIAIADELVNGLHHAWIRTCIEALGERQVFLTSQNPLLLDYLPFESPEQVRSTFVLCRWEEAGDREHMVWENMSQEAAQDFFESYQVGFQQVGELLQVKGLW